MSFSRRVVMTFLFRAVRSGPVRLFVESKLNRELCCLFAVVVVVLSSSLVSASEFTPIDGNPKKDSLITGCEMNLGQGRG